MRLITSPSLVQKSPYVCPSCTLRIRQKRPRRPGSLDQKRSISETFLWTQEEAKLDWARQASEIKSGKKEGMLTFLEKRGFVNQIVGERDDLDRLLTEKRVGVYVGVDPTARSMHVGHLLPLMALYWMYGHGFHACSLLGGATAKIGDPAGRTSAREAQHSSERKANMVNMHYQLKSMWEFAEKRLNDYGFRWSKSWKRELANNNAWLNKLPAMELLKMLGPGVRLGTMLGRDTVKTRMKSGDGMSVAEFLYPMIQAWDWWHMYSTKDIQMQIGGADQFGNILAGIDAINYINKTHTDPDVRLDESSMRPREALLKRPMGFTIPLLTTSSGEKFGKSAGNAIWLDGEMTSPFELYQFFLRTADTDVHRYLKLFTFEPLDFLGKLMEEHDQHPSKRAAQHKLAREVLRIVHGPIEAKKAEDEHEMLFNSRARSHIPHDNAREVEGRTSGAERPPGINQLTNKKAASTTAANAPSPNIILPRSLIYNQPMSKILYHAGLVASRSEGHRLVDNNGAYVGSKPGASGIMGDQVDFTPALNWNPKKTEKYIIHGDMILLRVGKWKIKVVKIISDEEFEERDLTAPGWKEEIDQDTSQESPKKGKLQHGKMDLGKTQVHHNKPTSGVKTQNYTPLLP